MLEKTMKQVLTKKVNAWVSSVEDKEIQKVIKENLIITGGCFVSMMQNEEPNDFDCYFRTKEATIAVAKYYVNLWNKENSELNTGRGDKTKVFVLDGANPDPELLLFYGINRLEESKSRMIANTQKDRVKVVFPSDGIVGNPEEARADEELGTPKGFTSDFQAVTEVDDVVADALIKKEKKEYFPVFLSTNAITLSNGIQIVVRFYGEPDQVHDTFDFVHTKSYYTSWDGNIVVPKEVYEAVLNKTLRYTGSKYPVCTLFRLRKFISRGWTINAGQILRISMQISELDLTDIDVLEDQLVGVDSIYFMQLINQFRQKRESNPEWELTSGYVMSIVDKIF